MTLIVALGGAQSGTNNERSAVGGRGSATVIRTSSIEAEPDEMPMFGVKIKDFPAEPAICEEADGWRASVAMLMLAAKTPDLTLMGTSIDAWKVPEAGSRVPEATTEGPLRFLGSHPCEIIIWIGVLFPGRDRIPFAS